MFFSKSITYALLLSVSLLSAGYAGAAKPQDPKANQKENTSSKSVSKEKNDKEEAQSIGEQKQCPSWDISKGFSQVAEMALPAVVNVATTQVVEGKEKGLDIPRFAPGSPFEELFRDFLDQMERPRRVTSLGSGFIIKAEGKLAYIVTNYHVIADAKKISIFLHDKTEVDATVHAYDERTDIAVLKISGDSLFEGKNKLAVLEWGNADTIKVGEWVLAIGNPFGLGSTVTAGIISSKGRDLMTQSRRISDYVDFLQHSAQINMGNSGGCLLGTDGKVVGINTAIFSPSGGNVGIGFAIPADVAKATVDQLIEFGRTKRGWLGVRIQHLTEDMAESLGLKARGAIVGSVTTDGPAQKAGIQSGDVILEFDGKPVSEGSRLSRLVGETPIGKNCKVKIWRKGQELTVEAKIGEFEEAIQKGKIEGEQKKPGLAPSDSAEVLGMQIGSIPDEVKQRLGQAADIKGVFVLKVDPNSTAAETGLARGDIIMEANQKEILKPKDLIDSIEETKKAKRKHILLLVNRGGEPRFVSLKIENEESAQKPSEPKIQKSSNEDATAAKEEKDGETKPAETQQTEQQKGPVAPEHPANVPPAAPVT